MDDGAGLRHSPLHAVHVAAGARMVDFAGWHMPVQYTGVIDEHAAVRERAGLFDVSHMGEAQVRGRQALELLQKLTCNDVSRLTPGRAHYTALTTERGTIVDDLLVYRLDEHVFLLVINAANTSKDVAWLASHAQGLDVEVQDVSADWALLALQGPHAVRILEPLTGGGLAQLRSFGFRWFELEGAHCLVSRTGYTGEDGFEIYAPPAAAADLWYALLGAGAPHGLVPAGLGARDTLRLEAKLMLYGKDIDETTTVVEADLGWIVKLEKGDFLGRDVLARQLAEGVSSRLVGLEMRGRAIARDGHPILSGSKPVGRVTSGSWAPSLKKGIALGYVSEESSRPGTALGVEVRGRTEEAAIVPTPFYRRA